MNNDLIRREAAINTVFSMCCRWNTSDPEDLKNMLMTAFQDLPSAQPERKKGKWIHKDDYCNGIIMRVCKCSACGANAGIGEDGFWYKSNFCPNCGAEMKGVSDE